MKNVIAEFFIGWIAHQLVRYWVDHRTKIEESLKGLDETIEQKWEIDIPDEWQKAYDQIVTQAVAWVDQYARTGVFWRNLLRNLNEGKMYDILERVKSLNWETDIFPQLPDDIKILVNEEKEKIAKKIVENKVVVAGIPDGTGEPVLEAVRAAASSNKINEDHTGEPITKELLEKLLKESQARQETLKK